MAIVTVDTLSDDPSDGTTLREAVAAAADRDGDTIVFAAGLSGAVHLGAAGQLTITGGPLTIDGDGRITIDANADGDGDAATYGTVAPAARGALSTSRTASRSRWMTSS